MFDRKEFKMVNQNMCALSSWLSFIVSVSTYEADWKMVFEIWKKIKNVYLLKKGPLSIFGFFEWKQQKRDCLLQSSLFFLLFRHIGGFQRERKCEILWLKLKYEDNKLNLAIQTVIMRFLYFWLQRRLKVRKIFSLRKSVLTNCKNRRPKDVKALKFSWEFFPNPFF